MQQLRRIVVYNKVPAFEGYFLTYDQKTTSLDQEEVMRGSSTTWKFGDSQNQNTSQHRPGDIPLHTNDGGKQRPVHRHERNTHPEAWRTSRGLRPQALQRHLNERRFPAIAHNRFDRSSEGRGSGTSPMPFHRSVQAGVFEIAGSKRTRSSTISGMISGKLARRCDLQPGRRCSGHQPSAIRDENRAGAEHAYKSKMLPILGSRLSARAGLAFERCKTASVPLEFVHERAGDETARDAPRRSREGVAYSGRAGFEPWSPGARSSTPSRSASSIAACASGRACARSSTTDFSNRTFVGHARGCRAISRTNQLIRPPRPRASSKFSSGSRRSDCTSTTTDVDQVNNGSA